MKSPLGVAVMMAVPVSCLVAGAAVGQEVAAVPEKALKYHEALLKRPQNAALFDRFFGAWIDEQPVEALGDFLKKRAAANGGQEWAVLAVYQLRRGNEEEALAALGKGIDAVPDDPALAMERGKLRLRRLEFDGARADFAKVAAGKDEVLALEAAKLSGKAWLREGKTAEAVRAWDAVLAAHPGDEDLLEDLVETAAAESETAQALVYAEKLVAASRDPYQKTLRMLRRGDLLAQAGRSDEAVEAYTATLGQVGDGSWLEREVLAQIEKIFRKQDRLADLTAQLKKLAEAHPQRLLIHRQLAKLEAAQGETDSAIGRFREVLKRSPGERELREEFVRLLTDGERFDDAAAELGKLIELAPADSGLYLQVAALRSRQGKPDAVLAALNKAHELLGKDESNGIRIAGLMLQYNLAEPGEALLKQLAEAPGAGPAAMEALAAQYGRTNRKDEAVALLKKAGAGDEIDVLLRTCGSISALGESDVAFGTLAARAEKFSGDPRFLAALAQAALAAGKPAEAVPQALKLVRLAKQAAELSESINLASRVVAGAEKAAEVRDALAAQATRTAAETCLLASLTEDGGDLAGVGKLLELDPDPLVIHFHAALLDRRGDFDSAIAVLTRLADTAEGRKAGYFKDLSELQQRAGKTADALATVERWKLAAPGDKSAWITGSRLLRESGKPEEAVKMTRQAVGRFEGDTDLAASLAGLHDEAGQWADAEAIYWKLYDEAQAPADQARWAAQLAQLAQRTAKTAELEDKLRERARGNRRSIGPILALAELARVTDSEDKRRDLLLEAVRLQPKDLDLRLQIATLEEQAGNAERVVAVLEEALPYDVNGRVRSALAQAYLRQGQAVKGMRELRLLSGKTGFDTRAAESAAAALAGTKLYDEAINLLRTELPDGGDWRSRYLLALLLEEDGRETEALPIFLELLQAQGEIATTAVKAPTTPQRNMVDQTPEGVRAMQKVMTANQIAYAHRRNSSGYGYSSYGGSVATQVGTFYLPNTAEDVRQFALAHLCGLSKKKTGEVDESVRAQIKAAGINNAAFLCDLATAATPNGERTGFFKLLENYPEEPGLFEWLMWYGGMYGNSQKLDDKLIRRVLEKAEGLSPMGRFNAWASIAMGAPPEDPAWTSLLAAAKDVIEGKSPEIASSLSYRLMYLLQGQQGTCPEVHRPAVKKLMLDSQARMIKEHPENAHNPFTLSMLALGGTPEEWLAELNAVIRESRKITTQKAMGYRSRTRFSQMLQYASRSSFRSYSRGYNPFGSMGDLFNVPTLDTIPTRSIPAEILSQFAENPNNSGQIPPPLSAVDLQKRSAEIESPFFRAWLAAKTGNKQALAEALAAAAPPEETFDFEVLRAVTAIDNKQGPEAFAALLKARAAAGSDKEFSGWVSTALIAVAGTMTAEERTAAAGELQATFLQSRQVFGVQGAPLLAAQARKLGLEELAKRIEPPGSAMVKGSGSAIGPAAIASAAVARGSSSSSQGASPEKIRKFIGEKKYEAAAREVLQGIRGQNANRSSYYMGRQLPELVGMLGKEGQAELIKLVDPGDSKSLVRRLEYVDVCNAAGKPELMLAALESLAKERPDDGGIAARLVFAIPPEQMDRRIELMNKACRTDEFFNQASSLASTLDDRRDDKKTLDFFEATTRWLETAAPKVTATANLTWVSYYGKQFFSGSMSSTPSLLSAERDDDSSSAKNKELVQRQQALCKRLARAMMRHSSCAEEGFRLLAASKVWKIEPAEMDANARAALLAVSSPGAADPGQRYSSYSFFSLISNDGGSTSGEDLSESSSAVWLINRLKSAKSPGEIFPPDFLASLKELNPKVGEFMSTLLGDLKAEDLALLWKSDLMKSQGNRLGQMLRPLVLRRVALTPGATKFFVDQISAMPPGSVANSYGNGDWESSKMLFSSAINSSALGAPGELDAVAKAIVRAVFGEKVDFTDKKSRQNNYQRVNYMSNICQEMGQDALVMVRFQSAFFRLGVPVDDDGYSAVRPFSNKRFSKPEEAEAFLESLGWLSDVDHWEPFACVLYKNSSDGMTSTLEPKVLLEQVMQYMNNGSMRRDDLVKRLKERKKGRFGSLMIAAAMSEPRERSALVGQAFAESADALAKLPPQQVDRLAMIIPWLDEPARAKLPEGFRRKAQSAETKLRQDAVQRADQFIQSLKSGQGEYALNQAGEVVKGVVGYDLDKAVEVYVAAEQNYTDMLARGGRYSNSSSGDWQFSTRDYVFNDIISDSDSPLVANPSLKLKFVAKILATPSGKRLVFYDDNYSDRSLFPKIALPLLKDFNKDGAKGKFILGIVRGFQSVDPSLKAVALPCFLLAGSDSTANIGEAKEREALLPQLAKLVGEDPQAARLATARLALWSWKFCTAEEKAEALRVFAELVSDKAVPDVGRLSIATDLLAKLPKEELLRAPFPAALDSLYQEYCGGERTAVNQISSWLFTALVKSPYRDESVVGLYASLARNFWENAMAMKPAGHPPIPAALARSVFITALLGKDSAAVTKYFPRIKDGLSGKLSSLIFLMQFGHPDLARQLAPLPAEPFQVETHDFRYDRAMESSLAAFKQAGADGLTLQKLEIEMLRFSPGKDADAPAEAQDARMNRLIEAFVAAPPEGAQFPVMLQTLLSKSPGNPKLLPLLTEWAKRHQITEFLRDENSRTDPSERSRTAALKLLGISAMHAFATGDTAQLQALKEAADTGAGNQNNRGYYLSQDYSSMMRDMALAIWTDVCADRTSGYQTGLQAWNDFAVQYINTTARYGSEGTTGMIATSYFLACWAGDIPKFTAMIARLPEGGTNYAKQIPIDNGFTPFVRFVTERNSNSVSTEERREFIAKTFCQPGFANAYPKLIGWLDKLAELGNSEVIHEIAVNPPEKLIPEIRPALYGFHGRSLRGKKTEEAQAFLKKGIDACPAEADWNALRGVLKWELADELLAVKNRDESKKVFATIAPEEVADWLKDRYQKLGKALEAP